MCLHACLGAQESYVPDITVRSEKAFKMLEFFGRLMGVAFRFEVSQFVVHLPLPSLCGVCMGIVVRAWLRVHTPTPSTRTPTPYTPHSSLHTPHPHPHPRPRPHPTLHIPHSTPHIHTHTHAHAHTHTRNHTPH